MQLDRLISVSTDFIAQHRWKDAPDEVQFLRSFHRHVFKVRVDIEVFKNDRELEFFMVQAVLRRFIARQFAGKQMDKGCEQMAEEILIQMHRKYGAKRNYGVEVSEDGENAGYVCYRKDKNKILC